MKPKFYIQDWAGNDKTAYYGEFNSLEDAVEALSKNVEKFVDVITEADYWAAMDEFVILERGAK